jgi:hypothetical protein
MEKHALITMPQGLPFEPQTTRTVIRMTLTRGQSQAQAPVAICWWLFAGTAYCKHVLPYIRYVKVLAVAVEVLNLGIPEIMLPARCYRAPTPVNFPVNHPSGVCSAPLRGAIPPPTPSESGFADVKDSLLAVAAICTVDCNKWEDQILKQGAIPST